MEVHIPEDLGGALRVFEEDTYEARIQDLWVKPSKESEEPKCIVKWVITTEFSGKQGKDYISTVGENILENYSLQPQAVWNLNDLYIAAAGERIPMGDYPGDTMEQMLKEKLLGFECKLRLEHDSYTGTERMHVAERIYKK